MPVCGPTLRARHAFPPGSGRRKRWGAPRSREPNPPRGATGPGPLPALAQVVSPRLRRSIAPGQAFAPPSSRLPKGREFPPPRRGREERGLEALPSPRSSLPRRASARSPLPEDAARTPRTAAGPGPALPRGGWSSPSPSRQARPEDRGRLPSHSRPSSGGQGSGGAAAPTAHTASRPAATGLGEPTLLPASGRQTASLFLSSVREARARRRGDGGRDTPPSRRHHLRDENEPFSPQG